MKHDGHFQPYAYGITAAKQKSIRREREREGESGGRGRISILVEEAREAAVNGRITNACSCCNIYSRVLNFAPGSKG